MKISVIISIKNITNNVNNSINSILSQTYHNFELLIYLDQNLDKNKFLYIKRNLEQIDSRIFIFNNGKLGLPSALNYLISKSDGDFIARMDDDDISKEDRFAKQINYLIDNPEIDVLGTQAIIKSSEKQSISKLFTSPKKLRYFSNFISVFIHPSIMVRRSFFIDSKGYDNNYMIGQDFELFNRMNLLKKYENLDEPLLIYNKKKQTLIKSLNYFIIKLKTLIKNKKIKYFPHIIYYLLLDIISNL